MFESLLRLTFDSFSFTLSNKGPILSTNFSKLDLQMETSHDETCRLLFLLDGGLTVENSKFGTNGLFKYRNVLQIKEGSSSQAELVLSNGNWLKSLDLKLPKISILVEGNLKI